MDHIPSAVASGGQRRLLHCKVDSAPTFPPRSTPAAPHLAAPQSPLLPISGRALDLLDFRTRSRTSSGAHLATTGWCYSGAPILTLEPAQMLPPLVEGTWHVGLRIPGSGPWYCPLSPG